ncbi:hypothetical protein V6N12_031479 [Hibiscus sabdariffa]|uniref:Uncharacterized protein n=1 Tax=Hibiscus sabdariffa TaxID=183260 RepID=A0ABR2CQ17_9ROSI
MSRKQFSSLTVPGFGKGSAKFGLIYVVGFADRQFRDELVDVDNRRLVYGFPVRTAKWLFGFARSIGSCRPIIAEL